ncbi:MAG: flagellar hook-length control protein FliK [Defluviitaleaceae bacterium]|nr:flagellar hook-length control protein FliK [Defluviitaleaceae bacterium]
MKIIDMVNGKFSAVSQPPQKASGAAFDAFFAEAGRNLESLVESSEQSRTRDDAPRNRRSENPRREEPPTRRRETQPSDEDVTATAATAVVQEQQSVSDEPTDSYENVEYKAQITEKVAEVMQVPVEVVVEWLEESELQAYDLNEPKAVAKMLQYAFDAEKPADLLTDEKFPESYKAVNEAVAEIVAEAKPKAVVQSEVKLTEETINKLTEALEDAEVVTEDGEVVVTAQSRRESADSTEQQSTTAHSDETDTVEVLTEANDVIVKDEAVANDSQVQGPTMNIEAVTARTEAHVVRSAPQAANTNVIEQVINQVKVQTSGGQFTEMRITLKPESLGDIILRVVTQNGIVMAQFEAENQRVKEALEASMNQLRDALEEAGIKFSELSVSVGQDENERMNQFNKARQESRHRADSIDDATEEQPEISHHNGVIDVTA